MYKLWSGNREDYMVMKTGIVVNYRPFLGQELLLYRSFLYKEHGFNLTLVRGGAGESLLNNLLYQVWLISFEVARLEHFVVSYKNIMKMLSSKGLVPLAFCEENSFIGIDRFSFLIPYIVQKPLSIWGFSYWYSYCFKKLFIVLYGVFLFFRIFGKSFLD